MCSVYYKSVETVDDYVLEIANEIQKHEGIKDLHPFFAIVYAGPKFRLETHIDSKGLVRYHIPLITNDNSYFETFEPYQKHYAKPGELWRLETHLPHTAQNDDENNYRVHLIVDFL
jgi:aspartyl/asparaginyl beta-hydroxylase (cupin superfamily)